MEMPARSTSVIRPRGSADSTRRPPAMITIPARWIVANRRQAASTRRHPNRPPVLMTAIPARQMRVMEQGHAPTPPSHTARRATTATRAPVRTSATPRCAQGRRSIATMGCLRPMTIAPMVPASMRRSAAVRGCCSPAPALHPCVRAIVFHSGNSGSFAERRTRPTVLVAAPPESYANPLVSQLSASSHVRRRPAPRRPLS
jgi:hypothetical protein